MVVLSITILCTACSMPDINRNNDITLVENESSVMDLDTESLENMDSYLDITKKYSGDMEENLPNGQGTYQWDDNTSYSGEWKQGKADGNGVYKSKTINLEGTFSENKLINGQLTAILDNAEAVFTVADGEISYNKVNISYKNGDIYEGEWNKGLNGIGTLNFKNGDSYTGKFVNSKRDGEGIYMWNDGASYDGMWEDDMMHGTGIYYFNFDKSKRLEGNFSENSPKGTLKYVYMTDSYTTEWVDGKCTVIQY